MDIRKQFSKYILDYLLFKGFEIIDKSNPKKASCPVCKSPAKFGNILANNNLFCLKCNKKIGDVVDIVRLVEPDRATDSDQEIVSYIRDLFETDTLLPFDIDKAFDFFEKNGFDLVPIVRDQKDPPIEYGWKTIPHKNKIEWNEWLKDGINFGIKAGVQSGVIIVDVDDPNGIPEEVRKAIGDTVTLTEFSRKGPHFFYKYDPIFDKNFRINELKTDVFTNEKYVALFPSVVGGIRRKIILKPIIEMPPALKELLLSKMPKRAKDVNDSAEIEQLENLKLQTEEQLLENVSKLGISPIAEGNRSNTLIHIGGILRKNLNPQQTSDTLSVINRIFCKPSLPQKEMYNVCQSIDKYTGLDNQELARKVLSYLKVIKEATNKDVREALGETTAEGKQRVDKALAFLVKEGYLYKKTRMYVLLDKTEFQKEWMNDGKILPYKVPYFGNYAVFRDGDIMLIAAPTGVGKSHAAMNLIKQFNNQGVIPDYYSSENGSRFSLIAKALGLKEGDFEWKHFYDPESIGLRKNKVTIIDWLMPKDFATVDKLFAHFANQMWESKGFLIIFMQLRKRGEFFAQDLIDQMVSSAWKFQYADGDASGKTSFFEATKIREHVPGMPRYPKIPMTYDFVTKKLEMIEDKVVDTEKIQGHLEEQVEIDG